MTHFDWEMDQAYDHDLITLLEILNRTDLKQFASDLKVNDTKLFNALIDNLTKERDNARRS